MGALTSKPTAYNFRTWDVNSISYISCQDSLTPLIRVDIYQRKIVRVLPLDEWINDSQRFLFLNLDKQTLKFPGLIFKINATKLYLKTRKLLRQHTYTSVINYLVKRINKKSSNKLNLNLIVGALFTKNVPILSRLCTKNTNLNFFAKNSYLISQKNINFEKYNEIFILNTNPRLDSPLLDLSLKSLDKEFTEIKSIGNFNNDYEVLSNNIKNISNINKKSLLIYGEFFKDSIYINNSKNDKYNISPVYLNNSCVFFNSSIQQSGINFHLGKTQNILENEMFNVEFSTHVSDLNFDIHFPISNYFVSSGDLISVTGHKKLKMLRPSFGLQDHIKSLSLMLQKTSYSCGKSVVKVYDYVSLCNNFFIKNRLSFFEKKSLLLSK